MANRKGVFLGGYVPPALKRWLEERAKRRQHTVTEEFVEILEAMRQYETPKPVQAPQER